MKPSKMKRCRYLGLGLVLTVAASLSSRAAEPASHPRAAVLEKMAEVLQARYVDEARGQELATMLREASRTGRFANITGPEAFAKALTQALQQVSPDVHLRLSYEPEREFVQGASGEQVVHRQDDSGTVRQVVRSGRIDGRTLEELASTNFGIARVEHFEGNIGYLKLNKFVPASLSRPSLRAAIELVAHSSAVIVDLRGNIGGSPDTVGELLSPFFPAERGPVELHSAENRAMGVRDTVATDPALSRPKLATAPLFVLIDARSASAAEMFAYAARRAGRATLVGEKTRGAGNGGFKHSVGSGFALFLSEWRILSGPGWERVGVTPDVKVKAADALERALTLAKESLRAGAAAQAK